jgi:hypothetical protein
LRTDNKEDLLLEDGTELVIEKISKTRKAAEAELDFSNIPLGDKLKVKLIGSGLSQLDNTQLYGTIEKE